MRVGDVELDGWQLARGNRIAQRHGGVRVGRRIDNQAIVNAPGRADLRDQFALHIALEGIQLRPQTASRLARQRLGIGQGEASVNLRLARAEQAQVRTIEQQESHHNSFRQRKKRSSQ